jgi:hypothetical protein
VQMPFDLFFIHFLALWSKLCKHDLDYVNTHLGNLKYSIEASVAPAPIALYVQKQGTIVEHFAGLDDHIEYVQ